MEVPVQQIASIDVSAADPWTFAEEVMLGEQRYLIRWTVHGHYYAEVGAWWMEGENETAADHPTGSAPQFSATVKWDECGDWRIGDNGYLHTCGPDRVAALCGAVVYVQARGLQVLEARAEMSRLGVAKWV